MYIMSDSRDATLLYKVQNMALSGLREAVCLQTLTADFIRVLAPPPLCSLPLLVSHLPLCTLWG